MKKGRYTAAVIFAFSIFLTSSASSEQLREVNVALVSDGPWEYSDMVSSVFRDEIRRLTEGDVKVNFPPDKQLQGDWTPGSVTLAIDQLLGDDHVDLIVALGIIASGDACRRGSLPKPVIAPYVLDAKLQGISMVDGTSNVSNLSYITYFTDIARDLEVFREVVPFTRLAFLASSVAFEANPVYFENLLNIVRDTGTQVDLIKVGTSIGPALEAISNQTEAVYLSPLLGLPDEDFSRLTRFLIQRKLPSFSMVGESKVEKGILLGLRPGSKVSQLARQVAIYVQRILNGEEASTFPVIFPLEERLSLNMRTARKINVSPSWKVITSGRLIEPESEPLARRLSLADAAREGEKASILSTIQESVISASRENVAVATSQLLPQLQVGGDQRIVQADDIMPGFQTERSFTGKLQLKQLIYSDEAWTNRSMQGDVLRSHEHRLTQERYDAIYHAQASYLNILRAKSAVQIRRDNLSLMRSHLQTARIRQQVGVADPGEVYRLEGEIAHVRYMLVEALATKETAETTFNNLLRWPLDEKFTTVETSLEDPVFARHYESYKEITSTGEKVRLFGAFATKRYLSLLPELQELDAHISGQTRAVGLSTRSFWSPTVVAQGELSKNFLRSGAGSEIPAVGGDNNWAATLNVSIPVFRGGQRIARLREAKHKLQELELKHEAISLWQEKTIRNAIHRIQASALAIDFSSERAVTSRKSLDVVVDAYGRGTVSIISLLDAHNAVYVANEVASDAILKFFVDVVEFERSIGHFMLIDDAAADVFFAEVRRYLSEHL